MCSRQTHAGAAYPYLDLDLDLHACIYLICSTGGFAVLFLCALNPPAVDFQPRCVPACVSMRGQFGSE